MTLRDHDPIVIDKFNGLWNRGNPDNVPMDHFTDADNIRFIGESSIGNRYGIGITQDISVPLDNIKRIYNFPTPNGNTLIVLTYDYATDEGKIYHVINATTVFGPVLTISNMTDFAFLPYAGRGYISPFSSLPPTLSKPQSAPGALVVSGTGIELGSHKYAVSFVTAAGETTSSATVTVIVGFLNPTIAPDIYEDVTGGGNNVLDVGKVYSWKFTYSPDNTFAQETEVGPISNIVHVTTHTTTYGVRISTPIPDGVFVGIYRTVGDGSTYFRETTVASSILNNHLNSEVGHVDDATLIGNATAPISNTVTLNQVNLTAIPTGNASVTERNVYRTEANGTQLKLLTNLADNTTTVFTDNTPDASLGADAPTQNTAILPGNNIERGLDGEFLYVYLGDGTAARKAAGAPLTGNMTIANGIAGHTDAGIHLFGFVAETNTGYLIPPGAIKNFTTSATNSVSFGNVPTSGDPAVTKRHLVATRAIPAPWNGDTTGFQFFFVPNATIENNTDIFLNNISFYDADLLEDASYLLENFEEIPAGAVLTLYHNRLCLSTTFNDISLVLVSAPGEPEAIDQVDGLMVVPPDGNPISNMQELRDILYVFKRSRTVSFIDNGDVPSSWPMVVIDNALGTQVHGIGVVIDSGSASVDYLIIATYQGISLFNGRYITPELSFKIEQFWRDLDRRDFRKIQILNASIQKEIYIILPTNQLLVGNYANGMDPTKIRWMPNSFIQKVNTIAIWNIDEIILGSDLVTP